MITEHNNIKEWKTKILESVRHGFLENIKAEVQDRVGIWRNSGDAMPFLRNNNESVLVNEGVLSFCIILNNEKILYSVWLQAGEVRIGFKVPLSLLQMNKDVLEKKLSTLYDGKPCQRVFRDKGSVFFDWLFTDSFADFDRMERSFIEVISQKYEKPTTTLIWNRIYDILTHIFIASANIIIESNGYSVSPGFIGKTKKYVMEISGDINLFCKHVQEQNILIVSNDRMLTSDGISRSIVRIEYPDNLNPENDFKNNDSLWKIERIQSQQY